MCAGDVVWAGMYCSWVVRMAGHVMPGHVSKVAQRDQIVGHNVSESPEQCSVKPTILSSTMSNLPGHNVLNNLSHFMVYCC